MKFELRITEKDMLPDIIEFEGDLDGLKTYLKLKIDLANFSWCSVKRTDKLSRGDVEYWIVEKKYGELVMNVFAFYDIDPEINLNAMRRLRHNHSKFEQLGEGEF